MKFEKINDHRNSTKDELLARIKEFKRRLFNHRSDKTGEQVVDTMVTRNIRRQIAQIYTVIREKEIAEGGQSQLKKGPRSKRVNKVKSSPKKFKLKRKLARREK